MTGLTKEERESRNKHIKSISTRMFPLSVLEDIKAEIQEHTQRYTLARESGGMGQVDWSDYLIKADDVLTIIDNHIKAGDKE